MREVSKKISYKGKDYKLVFNLNVMEVIQDEYKSLDEWGALTDGKAGEVNVKALLFGLTAMLNECIEISNEDNNTNEPYLTHRQVGRMLTEVGIEDMTSKMNELVVDSTETEDTRKNV